MGMNMNTGFGWGACAVVLLGTACGGSVVEKGNPGAGGGSGATGGSAGSSFTTAGTGTTGEFGGNYFGGSGDAGGTTSAGTGGMSGFGGLPVLPLEPVGPQQKSAQLDVLFVVDNSANMADKQAVLAKSVPVFVQHLVNPPCLDAQGKPVAVQPASGAAACGSGTRQFTPVTDLHLGVITTSLGSHGGVVCSTPGAGETDSHLDDQAELIPSKRTAVASYMSSGFASFDAAGKTGDLDANAVATQTQAMITAAGETGCGYEAPLEAMYRFLVDPEPPVSVVQVNNASTPMGINQDLLTQRAAFLRPNSSVAVVVLTDENDCSIVDEGVGWFVGATSHMPKATAACATNPNDACCRSCAENEQTPPAGCTPLAVDANCEGAPAGSYNTWDNLGDSLNLRCFDQMQRFGFDLLNPLDRYSVGLTNAMVYDRSGALVQNPLLSSASGSRSASLISVSFIIGAPWQDLATDPSLASPTALVVLDPTSVVSEKRWPMLVGDPTHNVPPSDPFMVESIQPRTGMNPVTSIAISPVASLNPTANAINGHEQNVPENDDLQYACTFKLPVAKPCAPGSNCPCAASASGDQSSVAAANSPVCQPPAGGPASTTAYYAKAYPGARELLLAQTLGDRATPASICPKVTVTGEDDASFGYVPALDALARRIAVTLK
jgi:hypothetical protein